MDRLEGHRPFGAETVGLANRAHRFQSRRNSDDRTEVADVDRGYDSDDSVHSALSVSSHATSRSYGTAVSNATGRSFGTAYSRGTADTGASWGSRGVAAATMLASNVRRTEGVFSPSPSGSIGGVLNPGDEAAMQAQLGGVHQL